MHLPTTRKTKLMVRGYELGREDHEFDPRLGNFFPFRLNAWELRALKPQVGRKRGKGSNSDAIKLPALTIHELIELT